MFTAEAIDAALVLVLNRSAFPTCGALYVDEASMRGRPGRQHRNCYQEPGHTEGGCRADGVLNVDQPSPWDAHPEAVAVIRAKWDERQARLAVLAAEQAAEDEHYARIYAENEARERAAFEQRWAEHAAHAAAHR